MNETKDRIALYALTEAGAEIAAQLADEIEGCKLFLPEKLKQFPLSNDISTIFYPAGAFSEILKVNWKQFNGHILVMATGIVVRKIAPLLEHKTKDPAVVVCDEKGEYAISLLSGHIGGANRLATFAASVLGGESVITTATDVQGIMAFDELAAINGWKVVNPENIKDLNTMLLEGKKIAVDIPDELYQKYYRDRRKNISLVKLHQEIEENGFDGAVLLDSDSSVSFNIPVLQLSKLMGKKYILGIGCRRGTSLENIESAALDVLDKNSILKDDVKGLASVDLKADEKGLLEFAQKWDIDIRFFTQKELDSVNVPNPSEKVSEKIGISSVCEAAAILASAGNLVVEKQKYGNVTVAVGVME